MEARIEEGLKKIRFYDRWFHVCWISLLAFIVMIFILEISGILLDLLLIMTYISLAISFAIVSWGMIYHAYKRQDWMWFWLILIFGGLLFSVPYYLTIIRKEFKKGKTDYEIKLTSKDQEQIKHYQKHKEEIDYKGNKEFMVFMKRIIIVIVVIILYFIISKFFF